MITYFLLDDDAKEKLKQIHERLQKYLDREIKDEEDIFTTFLEFMDKVENKLKHEWKDSDLEQYD